MTKKQVKDLSPDDIIGIACGRCGDAYAPQGVKILLNVFDHRETIRRIEFDHPFCQICLNEFVHWWSEGRTVSRRR